MLDLRVHSATAESYFVKAGDYLQIIDVDGRQCTDFQCFSARKLDKGRDHPLDVTTTRTLMGSSYPMPGLHSKYYDQDMEPLVEVVQDTVRPARRLRACLRRANITTTSAIPATPTARRISTARWRTRASRRAPAGWRSTSSSTPAIDAQGVMVSDEPWSRPGDYVLLRALTDIVCVSSACPDDTTPANGWNLTDIHVRTYSGQHKFSRAIARRMTPDSEPKMTRETAFHSRFAKHTPQLRRV